MCREFDEVFEMGVKMGVKIGREEIDREVVANSVAEGLSMEQIANILKCPLTTVKKMVAQLNDCKSSIQ